MFNRDGGAASTAQGNGDLGSWGGDTRGVTMPRLAAEAGQALRCLWHPDESWSGSEPQQVVAAHNRP